MLVQPLPILRCLYVFALSALVAISACRNLLSQSEALVANPVSSTTLDLDKAEVDRLIQLVDQGKSAELSDAEATSLVAKLRSEFPYVSLRPRLEYESKLQFETPPMPAAIVEKLSAEQKEKSSREKAKQKAWSNSYSQRSLSLQSLHQTEVRAFVKRDGLGVRRGVNPGMSHVRLLESSPLEFDPIPSTVDVSDIGYAVDLPEGWKDLDNEPTILPEQNPERLLPREFVQNLHGNSERSFLAPNRFGHVESFDQVSGFRGHVIQHRPKSDPWDVREESEEYQTLSDKERLGMSDLEYYFNATRLQQRKLQETLASFLDSPPRDAVWLIRGMHLVSMLKHTSPRVYVSEHYPDMEELRVGETRELDAFESKAMERLSKGEQVVIASHANRIRMLGSIRATVECSLCHTVPEKQLLGAFSYDFVRNR